MTDLQHSGRKSPCPVCGRTKDADCSWTPDLFKVLCHSHCDSPPSEIEGYYWTGKRCDDGIHGPDTAAVYTKEKPKAGKRSVRSPQPVKKKRSTKEVNRDIQFQAAEVETHVEFLAIKVVEGIETRAQAEVSLAAWCKEHGHDRFSATQLLKSKLQSVAAIDPDDLCRLAKRYKRVEEKLSGRLRWNKIRGQIEMGGEPVDLDELRITLALAHNVDIPANDCDQICLHLAKKQQFSPIIEYLDRCYESHGGDDELLSSIAKTYLGSDSTLHSAYIRKTLISAVARAYVPGCKVDTVCILAGGQGVGKSTFWKILAGDYFDDSVGSVSDKDERLKLHKAWLVEWAELEAVFKRKDVSAVKAFITTQVDQIRPPYGRSVMDFPRPSIIVGTTNFDEFLADPTGNRRFWVVPVQSSFIPLDQLAEERDRIWAAAVAAYRSKESWTLPKELRLEAAEENRNYSLSDPWEEPVFRYLESRDEVSADEILFHAIKLDIDRQDRASQMRVTNLLKANGWRSVRRLANGRRVRLWISPNHWSLVVQVGHSEDGSSNGEGLGAAQPTAQPIAQPTAQPPENGSIASVSEDSRSSDPSSPTWTTENPTSLEKNGNGSQKPLILIGSKVRYTGNSAFYERACGRKHLEVLSVNLEKQVAEVGHSSWAVTNSIPLADLDLVAECPKGYKG